MAKKTSRNIGLSGKFVANIAKCNIGKNVHNFVNARMTRTRVHGRLNPSCLRLLVNNWGKLSKKCCCSHLDTFMHMCECVKLKIIVY